MFVSGWTRSSFLSNFAHKWLAHTKRPNHQFFVWACILWIQRFNICPIFFYQIRFIELYKYSQMRERERERVTLFKCGKDNKAQNVIETSDLILHSLESFLMVCWDARINSWNIGSTNLWRWCSFPTSPSVWSFLGLKATNICTVGWTTDM